MDNSDVLVVVPVFNEESVLGGVLDSLLQAGFNNILVIDDGSQDASFQVARERDVFIVRHPINLGYGATFRTAQYWIKSFGKEFKYVATFDGDGQHSIESLSKLFLTLSEDSALDFVLGSRIFSLKKAPFSRIAISFFASILTWILSGQFFADSHSGLRVFKKGAFLSMSLSSCGFGVASEMLVEVVRNKFCFQEVPIQPIYTAYSLKKGQKLSNSFNVVRELLKIF